MEGAYRSAFVFLKVLASPPTTLLAFQFPFPIVYAGGILGFLSCFALELPEHAWEVWERLKGNRIKGGFHHTESWQNIALDLSWHIIRTGSTLEIGPTSGWLSKWLVCHLPELASLAWLQPNKPCMVKRNGKTFEHYLPGVIMVFLSRFSVWFLLCSFGVSLFHLCSNWALLLKFRTWRGALVTSSWQCRTALFPSIVASLN